MGAPSTPSVAYARDKGSRHTHLVPPDEGTEDGLAAKAICGLVRYWPQWRNTGVDLLRRWPICARCAASARRHGHVLPELPLFVGVGSAAAERIVDGDDGG